MNDLFFNIISNLNYLKVDKEFEYFDLIEYEIFKELNQNILGHYSKNFNRLVKNCGEIVGIEIIKEESEEDNAIYKLKNDIDYSIIREAISNLANIEKDDVFRLSNLIYIKDWLGLSNNEINILRNNFNKVVINGIPGVRCINDNKIYEYQKK